MNVLGGSTATSEDAQGLSQLDRAIILATQAGLPVVARPFDSIALAIGVAPETVIERMRRMIATGVIRRIAAVPNHYALGYRANGMTVWDVEDERLAELGPRVGGLGFVSHCYHRPRRPPHWHYNLFAMVHARTRSEVVECAARIADVLGPACRGHEIIYSSAILKKTGLRLSAG